MVEMKTKFIILGILICSLVSAQDIIVTKNNEKIEAQIEIVSETDVHYKKVSNLSGPTFIMRTDNISSIIFANGEVLSFDTERLSKASEILNQEKMCKVGKQYFFRDSVMNDAQYLEFMKDNCPLAYEQYRTGQKKVSGAKFLLFSGVICDVFGTTLLVVGKTSKNSSNESFVLGGGILMGIGTICEIACIPLWIVGGVQRANSIDVFNTTCVKNTSNIMSLNLKVNNNGLGLAIVF